jgi:hypothetical protein
MGTRNATRAKAPAGIVIGRELVNDCARYAPALDLLYLNNPKCGCTTIKHALWFASDAMLGQDTFRGNVHDRKLDPFAKNVFRLPGRQAERIARAAVFSVVRNPFARALSAYVDKVANDPDVWPIFLKRFGLKAHVGKKELPFADFLGLIAVAHDNILDGHFRPQSRTLLLPLAKPVFVGFVENMRSVGRFLENCGVPFRDERMNATHAYEQLDGFYDSRTAALVRRRYAEDFARFGYSTNLAEGLAPPARDSLCMSDGTADALLGWLATGKTPYAAASRANADFAAFKRARETGTKLRIVRAAFAKEHDWSRLQRYAGFVRRNSRTKTLQDAIGDRMLSLRRRYAKIVHDPALFVELPTS